MQVLPTCETTIEIDVPIFHQPSEVDTSSLIVGASTTLERLNISLPQMARWLAGTNTPLIVIIRDSNDHPSLELVQLRAEALGIDATLLPNPSFDGHPSDGNVPDRHAQRHFSILHALSTHKTAATKWAAIIDDDTFFLSLPLLLSTLSAYDPDQPWYLGALSEDWHGVAHFGYMAYGGAGMILSVPLLQTLDASFEACKTAGWEGDILYRDCIYSVTSPPVRLTQLPGLHQMDFFGDVSGWYESGQNPILSLHHWKGWHEYPVEKAHLVTDVAGPEMMLQRFRFADDVVVSNAYSIVQYPRGLQTIDLGRVEGTFLHEKGQFDFSLGALRPSLVEGKDKVSWRFESAVVAEDGTVRQFYVKRAPLGKGEKGDETLLVDSVFELDWSR